jgi:hypothetical protein
MRFLRLVSYLLLLICFGNPVIGNEPGLPSLTRQTLAGAWEGLVGEWWVYPLEATASGEAYLAEVGAKDKAMQAVYRCDQLNVGSGRVTMRFRKVKGESWRTEVLVLRGKGFGDAEQGRLQAHLAELDRRGHVSGRVELTFMKPANRLRSLATFSKEAEKLIRESKKH